MRIQTTRTTNGMKKKTAMIEESDTKMAPEKKHNPFHD